MHSPASQPDPRPSTATSPSARRAVSGRAILLGAALIPANCWWMAVMEMQWNSLDSTCVSLFFHVIFALLVLTALNAMVARRAPRLALTQPELLTVYVMLSIASAVMGRDSLENLPSVLGYMAWFDNPATPYARFLELVPDWMAPHDKDSLRGYYIGNASMWHPRYLAAWLVPSLFWIGFILVLVWMMLCINVLLRRRWMEEEKLAFPLVQVPVAITERGTFANRSLWLGLAIPMVVQSLNNLNYLYPSVPSMHLKLQDVGPMFANSPPWNGLGWVPVGFFPFAIGFAFFLPLDLTFSCGFFYVARKLVDVGCVVWGFRDPGAPPSIARIPYVQEQGTGAWIGLSIALVWMARHHLAEVLRTAVRGAGREDPHAGMTYRTALGGLLAAGGLLCGACWFAGMSLWLPVVYFAFYFVLSVGITRVRAELGPPAHELNWVNPERFMVQIFGTQALGVQNLTLLSFMFWFNRGYRPHPMPHQLEALKICRQTGAEARRMLVAIMLAAALGAVFGMWALLDVMHRQGEATPHIQSYATGIGREAFSRLSDWADNPRPMEGMALSFAGAGAGFTLLLAAFKARLAWWPFHPIGYALANSYALEYFWSALMIGWLLKLLIVRYGGVSLYRSARPFFLGLILGDYIVASVWSLAGWALGVSTYRTFIF